MRIISLVLAFIIVICAPAPQAATCVGADPCRACKTCEYCKHCNRDSGTCGICKRHRIPHLSYTSRKSIQTPRRIAPIDGATREEIVIIVKRHHPDYIVDGMKIAGGWALFNWYKIDRKETRWEGIEGQGILHKRNGKWQYIASGGGYFNDLRPFGVPSKLQPRLLDIPSGDRAETRKTWLRRYGKVNEEYHLPLPPAIR